MANKFDGDVRPLSNDPRYMGLVFRGSMERAASIAKAAKEFPLPEQPGRPAHISRDRWNLLTHLNLSRYYAVVPGYTSKSAKLLQRVMKDVVVDFYRDLEYGACVFAERKPPKRAPAPPIWSSCRYSLAAAVARWPENFVGPS